MVLDFFKTVFDNFSCEEILIFLGRIYFIFFSHKSFKLTSNLSSIMK